MCQLALLHDVGAYKTEEIDNMLCFETQDVWEHSVYGHLFFKYFSPLEDLAQVILYHHANCRELCAAPPFIAELAQILFVADRFDVLSQSVLPSEAGFRQHFERRRNETFYSNVVDLLFVDNWEREMSRLNESVAFAELLFQSEDGCNLESHIRMMIMVIDFRSPQTVAHSFVAANAAKSLSIMCNQTQLETDRVFLGMLLHDIGKIGIPASILDKEGKLDPPEIEMMKRHTLMSQAILSGLVDDETLQIAVRHHERLNGTGYPLRLRGGDISFSQRIAAIADVFSALCCERSYKEAYPKEAVMFILSEMCEDGLLDCRILEILIDNYDYLMQEVEKTSRPIKEAYCKISVENKALLVRMKEARHSGNMISAIAC